MKILIFGASTTYGKCDPDGGWAQRLRKHIDEHADTIDRNSIFNLGISGNTSQDILNRFEFETTQRVKVGEEPIFIFSVGANDSLFLHDKQTIRVSPENYRENLGAMFQKAKKFSSKIVFVGLSPIDETRVDPIPWDKNKSYKTENIRKFNQIAEEVCNENNIHFINIFPLLEQVEYKSLLADGLHPTSEGHQKIFEFIRDYLTENKII